MTRAERFELVDSHGRLRGLWATDDADGPYLDFYDQERQLVLTIRGDTGGLASISVGAGDGAAVHLVAERQAAGLAITHGDVVRVRLMMHDWGAVLLSLSDTHDSPRLEVAVDQHGRPTLAWLRRPGERLRIYRFDGRPW